MNIVEVQDSLKNFSQDQLISEINQPSGMVPQFLVLTELGRRNRIKQDMEGRQAQNQPTVAQEVVSAAGVPQGGIMDMARSMAPKSSIEQNDAVKMMAEGGRASKPRNRFEAFMEYLRTFGDEEEVKKDKRGKSIAEIINFGGDYRPVKGEPISLYDPEKHDPPSMSDFSSLKEMMDYSKKKAAEKVKGLRDVRMAEGGVVKMQQGTVVYNGKTYFTDGTYVAEKGASGRIVPVNDPDIVEAVTKKSPSVTTDVGGISDISANLDTFNPVSTGISPINTPDPMFTLGNQMPPIAASEDKVDESDLPTYDGGMPFPLVKDKNFTLKPYEGPSVGAFDVTGTGSSENMDTVLDIPELTAEEPIESPDLKSIFEGSAIQYPDEEGSKIKGIGEINKILPDSVSTQAAPVLQAVDLPEQPTLPSVNIDNTSNLPDFSTTVDSPISRNIPTLKQSGALDAEQESLGADTFANLAAEQSLMDEGAKIAAAMDAEDKRLKPADKIDDDLFIDPNKDKDPDKNTALSSLESEIANMLRENEDQQEKDKYLSLAKAGLALMASDQPTFGGALGEAGMAGIEDFQASRKAYRDDKITLLDAQRKLEQARATAAAKDKSGLTGTNIVSTLNNIRNQKSKIMTKLAEITPAIDGGELTEAQKNQAEMLKREIANLTVMESTYAGMLGGIGSLSATGTFDATEK